VGGSSPFIFSLSHIHKHTQQDEQFPSTFQFSKKENMYKKKWKNNFSKEGELFNFREEFCTKKFSRTISRDGNFLSRILNRYVQKKIRTVVFFNEAQFKKQRSIFDGNSLLKKQDIFAFFCVTKFNHNACQLDRKKSVTKKKMKVKFFQTRWQEIFKT
jgi:hypothetical protein